MAVIVVPYTFTDMLTSLPGLHKMRVTPYQCASTMLSTLLLLNIIDFIHLTNPDKQSNLQATATKSQDTATPMGRQSEQHEHSTLPAALVRPSNSNTKARDHHELERQKGASLPYMSLKFHRHNINNCAEAQMSPSIQPVLGNHDHTDYELNRHHGIASETSEGVHSRTRRNADTGMSQVTTTTTLPTDNSSSLLSTFDSMFLCDHPPETFSPTFLGFSWEACLRYDRKFVLPVTDTQRICKTIFTFTENNPQPFTIGSYRSEVGSLSVITHKNFIKSCLPFFRRFNNCEERDFLTICWEERLVFLHSHNCPHSSNGIFLAGFLLDNNTSCFHEFCEGWQSVVDNRVGNLSYRLTNTKHDSNAPTCGYMTKSLSHIYQNYNGTLYILVNNYWPCCYPLYLVIWAGQPEDYGLNGAWSFLPPACQAGEVLLLVLVGCVMTGGVGGNLLVLLVMLSGGHRGQESSLLRTSLAFADLLAATFVVVPSFMQHLVPFLSMPEYSTVEPDMEPTTNPVNVTSLIYITDALHGFSGFPLFQSILFNTTSTVSLLMLLVLSFERFVITRRFLHYRDYFNYCRTILAITAAWITSIANALWFAASEEGGLGAQWLTFEKLPTGASGFGPSGPRDVIYHGQFAIFLILGISVAVFSSLAIYNFVREQLQVAAEWKNLRMKASRQFSRDNRHVLTTMTLMLILFLTSTLPLAINITMNSIFYKFQQQTLFSYLSWWLFMAASAWNPWVYNIRSQQFKEDLRKFLNQAKQACRQRQTHDDALSSPACIPSETLQWTT